MKWFKSSLVLTAILAGLSAGYALSFYTLIRPPFNAATRAAAGPASAPGFDHEVYPQRRHTYRFSDDRQVVAPSAYDRAADRLFRPLLALDRKLRPICWDAYHESSAEHVNR